MGMHTTEVMMTTTMALSSDSGGMPAWGWLLIALGVAGIIGLIACFACGGDEKPPKKKKKVKRAAKTTPTAPIAAPDVPTVIQETAEATQPLMQAALPVATSLEPIAATVAPMAQYAGAAAIGGPLLPMYSAVQQTVQMPTAQAYAPVQARQVQFPARPGF